MSAPTPPPLKTKPVQGNSVNVVKSPAGRRYHWIQIGTASTSGVARTIGVTIAVTSAANANAVTRAAVVVAATQITAATAIAGPITFRMSTRKSVTGWIPGLTTNDCR